MEEEEVGFLDFEVCSPPPEIGDARFYNTQAQAMLAENLQHLTQTPKQDVIDLVDIYPMLCKDVPGRTNLVVHDADVGEATLIKQSPYRYPPHKKNIVQEEAEYTLQIGVIEPADSSWSSPVVLPAQEGQADRFCVDYREPNSVTKADAFHSSS